MKNKKLNLEDLKVKSFVTEIQDEMSETAKGGFSDGTPCNTQEPEFCNWTYNAWCYSGGTCDTGGAFCTAPK
jgi:hypothetical protein